MVYIVEKIGLNASKNPLKDKNTWKMQKLKRNFPMKKFHSSRESQLIIIYPTHSHTNMPTHKFHFLAQKKTIRSAFISALRNVWFAMGWWLNWMEITMNYLAREIGEGEKFSLTKLLRATFVSDLRSRSAWSYRRCFIRHLSDCQRLIKEHYNPKP